jgi:hypothetical protein
METALNNKRDTLAKSEYMDSASVEQPNSYSKYDDLYKQYQAISKERDELLKELARLKDQKQLLQLKNSSMPSSKDDKQI